MSHIEIRKYCVLNDKEIKTIYQNLCDIPKVFEDTHLDTRQKRHDLSSYSKKLEKEQQSQTKWKKENKKDKTNDQWNRKQTYSRKQFQRS